MIGCTAIRNILMYKSIICESSYNPSNQGQSGANSCGIGGNCDCQHYSLISKKRFSGSDLLDYMIVFNLALAVDHLMVHFITTVGFGGKLYFD